MFTFKGRYSPGCVTTTLSVFVALKRGLLHLRRSMYYFHHQALCIIFFNHFSLTPPQNGAWQKIKKRSSFCGAQRMRFIAYLTNQNDIVGFSTSFKNRDSWR